MNILETIRNQVAAIQKIIDLSGLNSVITHIERAEFFLDEGINKNDEHLFTDVIYRTNHAFEGILKEAYKVIIGNSSDNKTPFQIEHHFLENDVLNKRVLELFTNYRKEWRNTSTHDYNLFFDQSEAFLAIVSVSAFCHVLLNQIHEKVFFNLEKEELEKKELSGIRNLISDYDKLTLAEKISKLILEFSKEFDFEDRMELEINGALSAFINSMDNVLIVEREPLIENLSRYRPDFIIWDKNQDRVVLEVRNGRRNRRDLADYLLTIMKIGKFKEGIGFYIPQKKSELSIKKKIQVLDGFEYKMIEISKM